MGRIKTNKMAEKAETKYLKSLEPITPKVIL
jgi:hypothetical protein